MATAKIVRMGNSLGVRIPKIFLEYLGVNFKGAAVTMEMSDNAIVIKKQESTREKKSFERLMEDYYQKPFDEIDVRIESEEAPWGTPVGGEVW